MRYVYTFVIAAVVGLAGGFYLWHQTEIAPDRTIGILVGTPKGRLEVLKTSRVKAREGHLLAFVVVNSTDVARSVTLGFFRGQTPVNLCAEPIANVPVGAHGFETASCRVRGGIVEGFPADPNDPDEAADEKVRAFDYRISFDGSAYYDPKLIIER